MPQVRWVASMSARVFAAVLLVLTTLPQALQAQQLPKLLVLASPHLSNPGNDQINLQVPDILTEPRQQEMEALVAQLATFAPTQVAVEFTPRYQGRADQRLQGYLDGSYTLTAHEADQIGIRLAARLGLPRVHAVDWNDAAPGPIEAYDWYSWGQRNGMQDRLDAITDPARASAFMPALDEQTSLLAWYRQINQPAALAASHAVYFEIAAIGSGDELIGATWVGSWYARNLKILQRIAALASGPDERVLVVYGQGHAYLLQQLARESGLFEVVSVASVLGQ